ncbi:HEAT repeat domain-containing protein [Desertifilum sp. FACHB-1129]|uniref:HEAT repeat domain-containing protein n=1 Tax=unclassified Desertifilum TaxID=2621682 RepID=UPI0016859229|nr:MULTISPECIES: HEAT repeat domain-containing protein [unclassified Desertifilum]MBD2312382.1 HEAT repeat domain-containing protein [Desertifilum sp. FACHB-1129]MBD2321165.1 HEAT repeat domain-containing protein [Desertifilum sp. FACHB-866]MBD2331528.1 HEAT repeat domain-containing protein [Desertifilum sp. FACHB-868]
MAIDSQLLQQASNPHTPPEQLRELAAYEDVAIRQLVVVNPNTPTEVLWELGKEFPAQLLENPLLPLLFLENPSLFVPLDTLVNLFQLERVPCYLKQAFLRQNVELQQRIAQNFNMPVSFFEWLTQSSEPLVRWAIAQNPYIPLSTIEQLAQDPDAGVRHAIGLYSKTPVSLLEQLAQDPDPGVRGAINDRTQPKYTSALA